MITKLWGTEANSYRYSFILREKLKWNHLVLKFYFDSPSVTLSKSKDASRTPSIFILPSTSEKYLLSLVFRKLVKFKTVCEIFYLPG